MLRNETVKVVLKSQLLLSGGAVRLGFSVPREESEASAKSDRSQNMIRAMEMSGSFY